MKYLLILVVALGSVAASCQSKCPKKNFPEELSKQDSLFIENVLKVNEPNYLESDVRWVEKHIELYVFYKDFTRIYYLNPKGTIETLIECHPDGNFVNYGLESD